MTKFTCSHCKFTEELPLPPTTRDAITCSKCGNLSFREGVKLKRYPRQTQSKVPMEVEYATV